MRSIAIALFGVTLALALSTCGDDDRTRCDGASDECEAGFVCLDDLCLPCVADDECSDDPFHGRRRWDQSFPGPKPNAFTQPAQLRRFKTD